MQKFVPPLSAQFCDKWKENEKLANFLFLIA